MKLLGATAHHVTTDFDEGPTTEHEVYRIDHTQTTSRWSVASRKPCCGIAAINWHVERRVFRNGLKTVVVK
jgi:formyltetrahydrofolate hydrolase